MPTVSDSLPYDLREGWQDIKPVPQNDPPTAMAAIAYEPEYQHAMDAFRYIQSVQEKSERALALTETIIRRNPGMFTVWNYRSMLLTTKPEADLGKELDLMEGLIKVHLKGYQVWQHRKLIVLAANDPSRELGFCSRALEIDSKNYHTWAYRHWVLCHFWGILSPNSTATLADKRKVWEAEASYADSLLAADIRNNSAWAHRFFVCFESGLYKDKELGEVTEREKDYALDRLRLVSANASAWNYLRGVLKRTKQPLHSYLSQVETLRPKIACPLKVEFEADALAELAANDAERASRAAQLYDELATDLDPIRASYYRYKKHRLPTIA